MEKKLFLVLGNHLFPESYFRDFKSAFFYMAEDKGLCTHFKYHKHKIILFLSAMREFRNNLEKKGYNIFYDQLDLKNHDKSYEEKLKLIINKNNIKKIICFEIEDKFFEERILNFCKKNQIQLEVLKNPMFLMTREEFSKFLSGVKKPFMATFYQMQRKSLKILVDEKGKPNGGKWSFDLENRKKVPSNLKIPAIPKFNNNIEEVVKIVEHFFKNHPGESKTFWYPTRRQDIDTLLN